MLRSFQLLGRLARPIGLRTLHFASGIETRFHCSAMPATMSLMRRTDDRVNRFSDILNVNQIVVGLQKPVSDVEYHMDSVMRKRRSKMKKHKLRKRRKREKAEKRKDSQG